MPSSVPPSDGGKPPANPPNSGSGANPMGPKIGAAGEKETMSDFLKLFTPEQRKKFMNIMIQNLTSAMQKEGKKAEARLKKEGDKIRSGDDSDDDS